MAEPNANSKSLKSQEKNEFLCQGEPEQLPRAFGRLTLLRRLARGGMGEVYLAATRGIEGAERPCVVKTIRSEHLSDKSFRARFLDETRIQAQLQHPGVAQILEAATSEDGSPYAVVEYVEGRHLGEVLGRGNQLGVSIGWADAVAIGICFGDALAHVHERTDASGRPLQIAHRDLSPQNVMLGYAGDLKLIDFGTAKGENRRCRTVSGIVFAKPGYVAPEVANQVPGGPQADLYAFGVMVWELIAGHRFLQGDAVEHQAQVAAGTRPLPHLAAETGCPRRLDEVLAKLTATNLEDRYTSARQAVGDLAELLKQAPSLADGDRSVRGRIAQLMQRLYPAEPTRSRADFARRVALARKAMKADAALAGKPGSSRPGIPDPSPQPARVEESDDVLSGTRYRLTKKISEGTMGDVWEAAHLDLGRKVALKVIPEAASRSPEARQRFRSEARAVARLDHPGIVNIHDFGITADGRFYYVMELLEGETLAARIERGAIPWRSAVRMTIEAASALGAAHDAGILHRDVTPQNLFIDEHGAVKLIDFGVAKNQNGEAEQSEAPAVVGTPEYISPEQAAGARADIRSDLYGLGAVLYEALTGTVPHPLGEGGSPTLPALLTAKITRTPSPPSVIAGDKEMPPVLDRILARVLDRDAAKRYATAGDFVTALEAVLRVRPRRSMPRFAVPPMAVPRLAPMTAARGASSRRALSMVSAATVFAVVLVVGLLARRPADEEMARSIDLDLSALSEAERATAPSEVRVAAQEPEVLELDDRSADEEEATVDPLEEKVAGILALHRRGRKIHAHHLMKELAEEQGADSAHVQRGLVTTARGVKAWGEAMKAAQAWVRLDPGADSRIALARLQKATLQGDPIATLQEVVKDYPENTEARRLLAAYSASVASPSRVATR